jgi:CDP-diacylglycerol pyrophosphatase
MRPTSSIDPLARAVARHLQRLRFVRSALLALALTGCAALASADPNALWHIVSLDCAPAMRTRGEPGMCTSVDLQNHFAVLKDIGGTAQHLLIPTDRISGIESPRLLAADAPNYWADAWDARRYVEARLKAQHLNPLADNQIGLEVNSAYARTQEQLHIHVDCVQPSTTKALARHAQDPLDRWTWDTIDGTRYRIMHVAGPRLSINPFTIVASEKTGPDTMAMQTIFVSAAGPSAAEDGWLIVNSGTDVDGGTGSAEVLLDHTCTAAR